MPDIFERELNARRRAESQSNLEKFLMIDLDLAFKLLETAAITRIQKSRHQSISMVRKVLETTRHFLGRVEDPAMSRKIDQRANELEAVLWQIPGNR